MQACYLLGVIWLLGAIALHFAESSNARMVAGLSDYSGPFSRYYTVLNSLQYTIVHLSGNFPFTEYTLVGRLVHVVFWFIAAAFIGIPTGLIIAVFTRELRGARAAVKFLAEREAVFSLQRAVRKLFARRRAGQNRDLDDERIAAEESEKQQKKGVLRKICERCLELTSSTPRQLTHFGYWWQVAMSWGYVEQGTSKGDASTGAILHNIMKKQSFPSCDEKLCTTWFW